MIEKWLRAGAVLLSGDRPRGPEGAIHNSDWHGPESGMLVAMRPGLPLWSRLHVDFRRQASDLCRRAVR
ncbi:hypothetical protein [Actinomadura miaoliensis]|uniref:Uncharacterized protein n=1 Tax=Actinomadura miaoliensis TaxID=430685 RepID=A0ABP7WLI8_9ACTN